MTETALRKCIVDWHQTLTFPEDKWEAPLDVLMLALRIPERDQEEVHHQLDVLLQNTTWRKDLENEPVNLKVDLTVDDGKVLCARWFHRRRPGNPLPPTKKRNPELRPVGTRMYPKKGGNGFAIEKPEGIFRAYVHPSNSAPVQVGTTQTSVSGVARELYKHNNGGADHCKLNGFCYFGLDSGPSNKIHLKTPIETDFVAEVLRDIPSTVTPVVAAEATLKTPPMPVKTQGATVLVKAPPVQQPKAEVSELTVIDTAPVQHQRPSVACNVLITKTKDGWKATGLGITAYGKTPQEAEANWICLYTTGELPAQPQV